MPLSPHLIWSPMFPKMQSLSRLAGPISGTTAYVLDGQRNRVPIGTPGELYLGGPRLANGYLNRPELTRERFVYVSLGEGNGERLYRTGDLVKMSAWMERSSSSAELIAK